MNFSKQRLSIVEARQTGSDVENIIKILQDKALTSFSLLSYLHQRSLFIDLAESYCRDVKYELNGKEFFAIALKIIRVGMKFATHILRQAVLPKTL